jgi:hypothetical protein
MVKKNQNIPSSPAQVAGFFVCGILVDYFQTLQNDQLESMLFNTWENTQ